MDADILIYSILGISIIGVVFYVLYRLDKRAETRWYKLAERLDFTYQSRRSPLFRYALDGKVIGIHRGRSIEFEKKSTGGGEYSARIDYTRIVTYLENPSNKFALVKPKGILGKTLDAVGSKDVSSEEFHRQFSTKSRPDDFASTVLASPELRGRLLQVGMNLLRLSGSELKLEVFGFDFKGTKNSYDYRFDLLCDVADSVEAAGA